MIAHYDMTTGEVITEGGPQDPATAARTEASLGLRLVSVEETTATRVEKIGLPADVADLPVDLLISRWS